MKIRKLSAIFAVGAMALVSTVTAQAQEASVTTSTSAVDAGVATTTTSSTTTAGTIQEFTPASSRIIVKTTSGSPVTYSYSKKTTFVDAAGNTITSESIRPGDPTTVYYAMEAGRPVVSRVVVNRTVSAPTTSTVVTTPATVVAPAVPVQQSTTSETTTTTTTGKARD
jgi:hypothetical protein